MRSGSPPPDTEPAFTVLLGPDYAGKSSVLAALAADGWNCISYDEGLVGADSSLINDLRTGFFERALRGLGTAYSADFILTLLQSSVVYLRDQIARVSAHHPAIVDSYYYKVIAKCALAGLANDAMFGWWRSFPQPRQVIYLDVEPETAWRRSGGGAALNSLEYYGAVPTWEGFRRFQTDLRRLMIAEIGSVPIETVRGLGGVDEVAEAVRRIARRDDAPVEVG